MPSIPSGQIVNIGFPDGVASPVYDPEPSAAYGQFPGGYQFLDTSAPVTLIFRISPNDFPGYTLSIANEDTLPAWITAIFLDDHRTLELTFDFGRKAAGGDEYGLLLTFTDEHGHSFTHDPQVGNDGTYGAPPDGDPRS